MTLVATLICNPADPALDATMSTARAPLPSPGPAQLAVDEVAADIPFEPAEADDITPIEARLRDGARRPADRHRRAAGRGRRKRLLLADMDSTMIGQECIDELADFVGLKAHVAAITERAMRGEIAFEPALRERVALLKDLPVSVVDEVLAERITLTPGGRELVRPCAPTAPTPAWFPAASPCSPTRSPRMSASTRTAPTCSWSRTAS